MEHSSASEAKSHVFLSSAIPGDEW